MLISSCSVNEVNVGILPIITNYSCNLFQNYFKGAKIWWLFAQLYKNPTDYQPTLGWKSQLGVDFKIIISIVSQEKKNKILCIHMVQVSWSFQESPIEVSSQSPESKNNLPNFRNVNETLYISFALTYLVLKVIRNWQ